MFVFIIAIAKYVKGRAEYPSALGKFTQHVLLRKKQISYLPVAKEPIWDTKAGPFAQCGYNVVCTVH